MAKKTLEQLADEIFKESAEDGEPVTKEEALEMAKMELGAKQIKNYVQSTVEKKSKEKRERKVDNEKKNLLEILGASLEEKNISVNYENEVKLHFEYGGNSYSVTLTKHRKGK